MAESRSPKRPLLLVSNEYATVGEILMRQSRFFIIPNGCMFGNRCNDLNVLKGFIFPVEIFVRTA